MDSSRYTPGRAVRGVSYAGLNRFSCFSSASSSVVEAAVGRGPAMDGETADETHSFRKPAEPDDRTVLCVSGSLEYS